MLSRWSVYRQRRRAGWRRPAAWRNAGVVVQRRRARLLLFERDGLVRRRRAGHGRGV